MSVRVRIDDTGKYSSSESFNAEILKDKRTGSVDKNYVSLPKQKEVSRFGFAYINIDKSLVV